MKNRVVTSRTSLALGLLFAFVGCEGYSVDLDDPTERLGEVFPVRVDHKWGVMDRTGRVIVEPTYDDASYAFPNHRSMSAATRMVGQQGALLTSKSKWCFATPNGLLRITVIDNDTWRVFNLGESLFALEKRPADRGYPNDERPTWTRRLNVHTFRVYDPFGLWKAPQDVLPVNRMSEGLLVVVRDGKFGFANRDGTIEIPAQYDAADAFSEGLAAVMIGDKWGFVRRSGELVIKPQFDSAGTFDQSLALVAQKDRKKPFFINEQGEKVRDWPVPFEQHYPHYGVFAEGLWSCYDVETELSGYTNAEGKWAISPAFKSAQPFNDGLAGVRSPDPAKSGFIDASGSVKIPVPGARWLAAFRYGLAWVERTGQAPQEGYVDKDGRTVWSPR